MKFAVIVIDMNNDAFEGSPDSPVLQQRRAIIPRIKFLVEEARKLNGVIVSALDSFLRKIFFSRGSYVPALYEEQRGPS